MIIDRLENASKYYCLGSEIEKALKFLADTNLSNLAAGRHELGNGSYVSVSEYTSKQPEESLPEYHEKYIDVQFVAIGAEQIGYAPAKLGHELCDFDTEKDIGFVEAKVDFLTLSEGMFAIIFPKEIHQPGISVGAAGASVRKAVAKVCHYVAKD